MTRAPPRAPFDTRELPTEQRVRLPSPPLTPGSRRETMALPTPAITDQPWLLRHHGSR
jgi:hypothetical protein